MRSLTKKERKYLCGLIARNNTEIMEHRHGKEWEDEFHKGYEHPMSNRERQIRYRLRKKATLLALELNLIYHAGLLSHGESSTSLVKEMNRELHIEFLDEDKTHIMLTAYGKSYDEGLTKIKNNSLL